MMRRSQVTELRAQAFLTGMIFLLGGVALAAVDHSWLKRVPEKDRAAVNPYTDKTDAIAAGGKLYAQHCSKCHGENLEGKGNRPALRSETVQQATDGELFWLLKNGDLRHGMPSWSGLPDPSKWQVVAFLRKSQVDVKAQ